MGENYAGVGVSGSRVCNCFSINQSKVGRKALGDHGTVLGMLLNNDE